MRLQKATPKKNVVTAVILFLIGSVLGILAIFGVLEFQDIFKYIGMLKDGTIKIEEVILKIQTIGDPVQVIIYVVSSLITMIGGLGQFFAVDK